MFSGYCLVTDEQQYLDFIKRVIQVFDVGDYNFLDIPGYLYSEDCAT